MEKQIAYFPACTTAGLQRCLLMALFLVAGCGGTSGPTGSTRDAPHSGNQGDAARSWDSTTNPDAEEVVAPPSGGLGVKVIVDRTTGNAPLTVRFSSQVVGCVGKVEYSWDFGTGTYSTKKDPGEFVFYEPGVYKVVLRANCRGEGKTGQDQVQIVVLDSADLTFSQVQIVSSTTVAPGETLSFRFVLYNKGDKIVDPFKVQIVLSKDEVYQPEKDIVLKEQTIQGMDDGRYTESKILFDDEPVPLPADLPDGSYFFFAVADPDNVVSESDEDNNVARATSFVTVSKEAKLKADLYVADFALEGAETFPGGGLGFSLAIGNQGDKVAKNFRYSIFASADKVFSEDDIKLTLDEDTQLFKVEPGQKAYVTSMLDIPPDMKPGTYWAVVVVDPANVVHETDETNNETYAPTTFQVETKEELGYDIAVIGVTATPHNTYVEGSIQIAVHVKNLGNETTSQFSVAAFASEEPTLNPNYDTKLAEVVAGPLAPGEERTITILASLPKVLKEGDYFISGVVDLGGQLDELDKGNNWGLDNEPIHVYKEAFLDLVLSDLYVHPAMVKAGAQIKVAYVMDNKGSTATGPFVNYIVLSQDANVTVAEVGQGKDILLAKVGVNNVEPNSPVDRLEKVTVPLALPHDVDKYYVGVIGDAEGHLVKDSDKTNQTLVSEDQLVIVGPQGGCFEDDLEPNNAPDQAVAIQTGDVGPLGLCAGEDWFSVHVPKGSSLVVEMDVESPLFLVSRPYDIDLEIYDPNGKESLDGSTETGDHERVAALAVPADGDYLLRVFPKQPDYQAHYTLHVQIVDPVQGMDLMPYHVHALPEATYPGGAFSLSLEVVNLGLEDAPATKAAIALLKKDAAPLDTPAAQLGTIDTEPVPALSTVHVSGKMTLPKDLVGGYYTAKVQIDPDGEVQEADESNNIGYSGQILVDETYVCEDDQYEPNDTKEIATPLESKSTVLTDLSVCPDLPDVFAIHMDTGVSLSATVAYDHKPQKGKLAVDVLDQEFALLDTASADNNPVAGVPYTFFPGTYYVRVRVVPEGGKAGPYVYSLSIKLDKPFPADACQGDKYEPNNSIQSAATIGCGTNHLTMCVKDQDYFKVYLTQGDYLTANLQHPDGQLALALYAGNQNNLVDSIKGNGTVEMTAEKDTVAYLAVTSTAQPQDMVQKSYTLKVTGIEGKDLALEDLQITPGTVIQGEDVMLTMKVLNECQELVKAGYHVGVFLSSDQVRDGGDMLLLESASAADLEANSDQELVLKAMVPKDVPPGDYYVLVVLDPDAEIEESQEDNNVAAVPLTVGSACEDDPFEPNDTPKLAAVAGVGTYGKLRLCPGNLDWYKIHVATPSLLKVSIDMPEGVDLDLRLYSSDDLDTPVAMSATPGTSESIEYQVETAPADFLVRVNGFLGSFGEYTMTVETVGE